MKMGQPIDLHLAPRYYQFNRAFAMRDIFDALVELITNCDDSYHRLFRKGLRNEDGGPILIEYRQQRKGKPTYLIVHDRAEGMTLQEMAAKLAEVGTRVSEAGDRGFMARGLRDCTELGRITVEAIKDERLHKCELTNQAQFIPWEDGNRVTREARGRLHIPRSNGTVVTLEIDAHRNTPRFDSIRRDLPWHFALRDILSESSPTKVLLKNLNQQGESAERIVYHQPHGESVCSETFEIPGYAGGKANLKLWRATDPFDDATGKFRRSGILVKGVRAIHECSLLSPEFERDPYGKRYFGRLDCPEIDKLLDEFDERREKGQPHPENNPSVLIDPNRQQGLISEHPFTKALFLTPTERLRALIARDREAERPRDQQITNQDMERRLDRLARRASLFLREQLEDLQELGEGEGTDKDAFTKEGVFIYPTYLNVAVGEERTLTYYVRANLMETNGKQVTVEVDDPALSVLDTPFELRPHRVREDRVVGVFRVRGNSVKDGVIIRASCGKLPVAQAIAAVVEEKIEEHFFDQPLEFEHAGYTVREGSRRSLQLFAKYPEVAAGATSVAVASSDSVAVPIMGSCQLVPVAGSNYARGDVVVQGRRLNAKAEIKALANGREAVAQVAVVQKPPEPSIPLKIVIRNEDFGNFRAMWNDREGKPYELLVSAQHRSLSRYLGPPPEYEGQDAPYFRVLVAEIVAEAVCRKALFLEAKERTWEFHWADLKEDHLIVDDVLARLQQRVRGFVADAHAIMLSDQELNRASKVT